MKLRISDGFSWGIEFEAGTLAQFSLEYKKAVLKIPVKYTDVSGAQIRPWNKRWSEHHRRPVPSERMEVHFLEPDGVWSRVTRVGMKLSYQQLLLKTPFEVPVSEIWNAVVGSEKNARLFDGLFQWCATMHTDPKLRLV